MEKLNELVKRVKFGVYITVNEHKNYQLTVERHLLEKDFDIEDTKEYIEDITESLIK